MGNGSPVGRAILTVVAVVGFFVFVAIAINTFDTSEDVQAVRTETPSASSGLEPSSQAAPSAAPPVGGVATGGGGTAAGSTSLALPVFGALGALTLLAAAQRFWRPRGA